MATTAYNADEVIAAFARKDYALAFSEALPHGIAGHSDEPCMISLLDPCGFCVPEDLAKTEEWSLRAIAQDSRLAWNRGRPRTQHG